MRRLLPILCLTFAVLLGSAGVSWSADFQKGVDAYKRGDYATALREWKPLAEQGDADAQTLLGVMYRKGLGVPQDDKTAVKWYKLAAEQGYATAQFILSYCQKLVMRISGGAFDQLFSVLEFDASDDLHQLVRTVQASPLLAG